MSHYVFLNAYVMTQAAVSFIFFFFNDTATTEIYTLSLHDALPISDSETRGRRTPARALRAARRSPRRVAWRKSIPLNLPHAASAARHRQQELLFVVVAPMDRHAGSRARFPGSENSLVRPGRQAGDSPLLALGQGAVPRRWSEPRVGLARDP